MADTQYKHAIAPLKRRTLATAIDAALALGLLIAMMELLGKTEYDVPILRTAIILIAASYEPLFTVYGRTAGKRFAGLAVVGYSSGKRLSVYSSYLRYFFKVTLGWKTFLFYSEAYDQLLHDRVADSAVIVKV